MKLIERPVYLNRLLSLKGTPDIKVITGIRRAGKSRLMDAFSAELSKDESIHVTRINLRLKQFEALLDGDKLYDYANASFREGKKNFLLIDEVQDASNFERIIASLLDEERFEIYLTGSNAFLLSSDLATLFGGRTINIHVYPFSFREYLAYFPDPNLQKAFDDYVMRGGMSGSYPYANPEDIRGYLSTVVRATVVKDVTKKYRLDNEPLLNLLVDFLMDNVGSQTSIRNIARALTSHSYATNDKTIGTYLDCLCKAYLFYPMSRYDIKGKKYLGSDKKYYLSDLGFRFALLGTKNPDYGHLYENIVALELRRRGYEVYVGALYDKEIDFVAMKNGEKLYVQVSDNIDDPATFEREVGPLLKVRDAFPKCVIARTRHPASQYEGIQIFDIAEWLSQ